MNYSTPQEIEEFIRNLGPNPTAVCDLDGNLFVGYKLTEGNEDYFEGYEGIKNPDNQTIPFGLSLTQLDELVEKGVLETGIFAAKSMDVRLPRAMVDALNYLEKSGEVFKLTSLTSREMKETIKIFKESGVNNPENLVIAADSGANLYVQGEFIQARKLSDEEQDVFDEARDIATNDTMIAWVKEAIEKAGYDPEEMEDLYFEPKGIAANIHWRSILEHYGAVEGAALDNKLGQLFHEALEVAVQNGPKTQDGTPSFKVIGGPMTAEIKLVDVDKGDGLEAIANAAVDQASHLIPSSFVFSGDDIAKLQEGKVTVGTDYFAAIKGAKLEDVSGIPFFNMHTNHPDADGKPDANKHVSILGEDAPAIAVTVKDPAQNVAVVLNALGLGQFLPKIKAGMVYGAPNGPDMSA